MSLKTSGQNLKKQCKIQQDSASPRLVNGINMDLLGDLSKFCERYLKEIGVVRKDRSNPIVDHLQVVERFIEARPRKVLKAKNFSCPSGYEKKLAYFESCIKTGKKLNPFLSRNVKNLQRHDQMQLEWNIHHFHISDQLDAKKNDGFMERSDYLLMACVTENTVYFITAMPHGKERSELWDGACYVQIIKDNWPELLERYRFESGSSPMHISNASTKAYLRYLRTIFLKKEITALEKLMADKLWVVLRQDQEICARLRAVKIPSLKLIPPLDFNNFTLIEPQLKVVFAASWYDQKWIISWTPYP